MSIRLSLVLQTLAITTFVVFLFTLVLPAQAGNWVSLNAGDLIKLPDDGNPDTNLDTAVYYFGADGKRYVFPNSNTYFTWYSDFSNVKEVNSTQLGTIGIGGNVTYRPGVKMIKIDSDPKTYAIGKNGARQHITSEAVAIALYGSSWNRQIDDMPDSFFSNYRDGASVVSVSDFDRDGLMTDNPTISDDKSLQAPIEVTMNSDGSFSSTSVTITANRVVRFRNNSGDTMRVKSDDLSGLDSAHIPDGLNYTYRFTQAGTWEFYNHNNSSMRGVVTVQ